MTVTLHIGRVVIRVWNDQHYLESIFEDGTKVPAAPEDTDEYRNQARDLGYGDDTWTCCCDHECEHHWLAFEGHHDAHGQPGWTSPTLWLVAHHRPITGRLAELVRWEETRVLEAQRALDKTTDARPWDKYREEG